MVHCVFVAHGLFSGMLVLCTKWDLECFRKSVSSCSLDRKTERDTEILLSPTLALPFTQVPTCSVDYISAFFHNDSHFFDLSVSTVILFLISVICILHYLWTEAHITSYLERLLWKFSVFLNKFSFLTPKS